MIIYAGEHASYLHLFCMNHLVGCFFLTNESKSKKCKENQSISTNSKLIGIFTHIQRRSDIDKEQNYDEINRCDKKYTDQRLCVVNDEKKCGH